jgi:hypothetical protein
MGVLTKNWDKYDPVNENPPEEEEEDKVGFFTKLYRFAVILGAVLLIIALCEAVVTMAEPLEWNQTVFQCNSTFDVDTAVSTEAPNTAYPTATISSLGYSSGSRYRIYQNWSRFCYAFTGKDIKNVTVSNYVFEGRAVGVSVSSAPITYAGNLTPFFSLTWNNQPDYDHTENVSLSPVFIGTAQDDKFINITLNATWFYNLCNGIIDDYAIVYKSNETNGGFANMDMCNINTANAPKLIVHTGDVCTPSWQNTSLILNYTGFCTVNDTQQDFYYIEQYDANGCGNSTNSTYPFTLYNSTCNYCDPYVVNSTYGEIYSIGVCNTTGFMPMQHFLTSYDANYSRCCALTGFEADCVNSTTFYENLTYPCTYKTPLNQDLGVGHCPQNNQTWMFLAAVVVFCLFFVVLASVFKSFVLAGTAFVTSLLFTWASTLIGGCGFYFSGVMFAVGVCLCIYCTSLFFRR